MKSNNSSQSNSKSEDTPKNCSVCAWHEKMGNGSFCSKHYDKWLKLGLNSPEPPRDSPLGQVTSLYDDPHVQIQERLWYHLQDGLNSDDVADVATEILAWHKAEIAKLFEQIRSKVLQEEPPAPSIHNYDHRVINEHVKWQLEALTRLENTDG